MSKGEVITGKITESYPVGYDEALRYIGTPIAQEALTQFLQQNDLQTFGNRMELAKVRRGVSLADLSHKTGISEYALQIYQQSNGSSEKGLGSIDILLKVCNALDVSTDFLLGLSFTLKGSIYSKEVPLLNDEEEFKRLDLNEQLTVKLAQMCLLYDLKLETYDLESILMSIIERTDSILDIEKQLQEYEQFKDDDHPLFSRLFQKCFERKMQLIS